MSSRREMEDEEWCAMDEELDLRCILCFLSQIFDPFEDGGTFYIYTLLDMY